MQLLILTGMSGSGKHTAFKIFEDFGYYCVATNPFQWLRSSWKSMPWSGVSRYPLRPKTKSTTSAAPVITHNAIFKIFFTIG